MGQLLNSKICNGCMVFEIHEKYVVEILKDGKLMDIIEFPYDTLQEASDECRRRYKEDDEDNEKMNDRYAGNLQAFVMDETTEDREPVRPRLLKYVYQPKKYLLTMADDGRYETLIYEL